ncbi:MAG TPA: hypothetical protein VFP12_15415 [Allosphingosinicella sp.]|nr:hypothetical protein [Allosphingosinicella sp.]
MIRGALTALLALAASGAAAQDLVIPPVSYPPLPPAAAAAQGFVPKGWRIEARAGGDLDGDSRPDLALVLRADDPANVLHDTFCEERFDTNPRILAILLAKPGGGYGLAVENHELIPRRENPCEVDPFYDPGQIAIERGVLRLYLERMMSAGGWDAGTAIFKWRWRGQALRLIGFDYSNVKRNTGALTLVSINYPTGRAKISTGNIGTDREKVRWKILHNRRPPTLDEIGDGLMFDPENLVSNLP